MPLSKKVGTVVVVARRGADKRDVMGKAYESTVWRCVWKPFKGTFLSENAWQIHCKINYMDCYKDTERNNVE